MLDYKCKGAKRGICKFTNEKHVELRGRNNGVWRTKLAEPYPLRLCKAIASAVDAAIAGPKADAFMRSAARPGTSDGLGEVGTSVTQAQRSLLGG